MVQLLEQVPSHVSDRIMTMQLPLERNVYAAIISVYAPTMTNPEEDKEGFYSQLRKVLFQVSRKDKLILTGDFNARVGCEQDKWEGINWLHAMEKCNFNRELLLALCSEYGLVITNTVFMQREHHKVTWMHPRSRHWHLLNYVITQKKKNQNYVKDTKVMKGADCRTNHQMVRSRVAFSVRKVHMKNKVKAPNRLDTSKIKDKQTKAQLKEGMNKALRESKVIE